MKKQTFSIQPAFQTLYDQFSERFPTYIIGGFIRNSLLQTRIHDIDMVIEGSIHEFKKYFPYSYESTNPDIQLIRLTHNQTTCEITFYQPGEFLHTLANRDFVINSIYYKDGFIYDHYHAFDDLQKKTIRALEDPFTHFTGHPQAFLRAIRLSSELGFTIDNDLQSFMKQHTHFFEQNTVNRIQNEGYRILSSPYPGLAIESLQHCGLISKEKDFSSMTYIDPSIEPIHVRFCYLSSIVGIGPMMEFLKVFMLSKKIEERATPLLPFLQEDYDRCPGKNLNEILLLKRLLYNNDISLLQQFLKRLKK